MFLIFSSKQKFTRLRLDCVIKSKKKIFFGEFIASNTIVLISKKRNTKIQNKIK